jgi:hypothetical protein
MDFTKLPRPSFTVKPRAEAAAMLPPFRGKALRRRMAMVKEAAELLPHLPMEPGTATHALLTGRADLMVMLVEMVAHYGGTCQYLRLATLSFNNRNTGEMTALLQSGRVATLTLLCSLFFRDHSAKEFAEARRQADLFPGRWALAAARNHAKIVCMDFGTRKVVAEGSANLRSNGNCENLMVVQDDGLHDWHAQWIDDMVAKYVHEEDQDAGE